MNRKNDMLLKRLLILCTLFVTPIMAEIDEDQDDGFPYWVLAQTSEGNKQFGELKKHDKLMTFAANEVSTADVVEPAMSEDFRVLYYVYVGETEILMCGGATRFFVANENTWVRAVDLIPGDYLLSNKDNKPQLIACGGCEKTDIGHFLLKMKIESSTHCYFVGEHSVLVHNHVPVQGILHLGVAFGEGAVAGGSASSFFGPVTIGVGAVIGGLVAFGISKTLGDRAREDAYLRDADNLDFDTENFSENYQSNAGTSAGGPEDPRDPRNRRNQSATGKPPKQNYDNESDDNIRKRMRGEERQAKRHEKKLEDYIKDPDAHDNKGYLRNAPNLQERLRRFNRRIEILKEQIKGYYDRANEFQDMLRKRGVR